MHANEQLAASIALPPCGALHPVIVYPAVSLGNVHALAVQPAKVNFPLLDKHDAAEGLPL